MGKVDWNMNKITSFFKKYGFTYKDLVFILIVLNVIIWGSLIMGEFKYSWVEM